MAGEPVRAGGSADAALPAAPPRCLARNCLTVRQFGPLESIDPNDAMTLPRPPQHTPCPFRKSYPDVVMAQPRPVHDDVPAPRKSQNRPHCSMKLEHGGASNI